MRAKDVLGRNGEQAAADYLETEGFRILARNWRCADGEIDIVAVDRLTFVVCEVKTRSSNRYGTPLESVSQPKRGRLRRLALRWLAAYGVEPLLLETLVDGERFRGTCYQASNWIHLGRTQGRGRMDRYHQAQGTPKELYVYPLCRHVQQRLITAVPPAYREPPEVIPPPSV